MDEQQVLKMIRLSLLEEWKNIFQNQFLNTSDFARNNEENNRIEKYEKLAKKIKDEFKNSEKIIKKYDQAIAKNKEKEIIKLEKKKNNWWKNKIFI